MGLAAEQFNDTLNAGIADSVANPPDAQHIFGPYSTVIREVGGTESSAGPYGYIVASPSFSLIVLSCLLCYCLLVYRFRAQVAEILNMFGRRSYVEKLLNSQNYVFETFLRLAIMLWLLVCTLAVVRYADSYVSEYIADILPQWSAGLVCIGLWTVAAIIWIFQTVLLRIAGNLTLSSSFTGTIINTRNLVFALGAVLAAPAVLMLSLAGEEGSGVVSAVTAAVFAIVAILLLTRTYMLFLGQKISILYWILYLCAVEILPLSFFVLIALRYMR